MYHIEGRFVYGDDVYVDDGYMDEEWEYINGFPDYMISNKARVWSIKTQQFLTVKPMDDHGHLGVCLYKDGNRYYKYIHRLVAEAFVPNPNDLPIVRHLYDDPSQNEYEDLSWGTQKDNIHDCIKNGRAYFLTSKDRYKGNKDRMMSIIAINVKTGEQKTFESQNEASRLLKIPQANIYKVIHGKRHTAGGYLFKEVM